MPALLTRMSSPPSSLDGRRDRALPAGLVGDVEVHEAGRAPVLPIASRSRGPVLWQVADHHRRAGRGQRLRHALPQAAGAAGDQRLAARAVRRPSSPAPRSLDRLVTAGGCEAVMTRVSGRLSRISLDDSSRPALRYGCCAGRGAVTVETARTAPRADAPSTRSKSAAASSPTRRSRRSAELGYARTSPARDRPELRVLARRRCTTTSRQGRPDHLLRAAVQGARACTRYDADRRDRPRRLRARRGVRRQAWSRRCRGRADAPPLVRPARPGAVRGVVPRRRRWRSTRSSSR